MSRFRSPWAHLSAMQRREARAGMLFVLPWVISLLVFTAYPVVASVTLSFTDYSIVQAPNWVGLQNYATMFTGDPSFWPAVRNSLFYAVFSVPLGLVLSLALALVLNMRAAGMSLYRTLFYLPSVVPPIAGTIVFIVMFEPQAGLVNTLIRQVGLPAPAWFSDPAWSKPGLIIMSLWGIGATTLIFLAGLQDIPKSLLESASIDGAGPWQKLWNIILPLLSPVILFNLVMNIIGAFQVFAQPLVIGGTTGAPLESMLMYMVHIYRNAFRYFKMGYASALSVVLFVAVMLVTFVIFRSARLWVFREDDGSGT
jgi:multiple sugar transport system permease protein